MSKSFVNSGFEPRASEYLETEAVNPQQVKFSTKLATVKVGPKEEKMVSGTLLILTPFSVTDCEDNCTVGTLNESIKIQFNVKYAETANLTSLYSELARVWTIWSGLNPAFGVVPPQATSIDG